jgi:hypothetical protein
MTATRFDTAGTIINDVAVEVGLAAVSDPFASTDPLFVMLVRLLKVAGRDLALERHWQQLVREATIATTGADSGVYDLPSDFVSMVDQSGWDRTNDRELSGPVSPQVWQYRQAVAVDPVRVEFRVAQNQIQLWPQPPAEGLTIAFEYRTRMWVQASGSSEPDKDAPTATADTVLFDPHLITRALKVRFLEAKGMDTAAALADYQRTLRVVAGTEPAPVLDLNGARYGERLVSTANYPATGFGS